MTREPIKIKTCLKGLDRSACLFALAAAVRATSGSEQGYFIRYLIDGVAEPLTVRERVETLVRALARGLGARDTSRLADPGIALIGVWDLLDEPARRYLIADGSLDLVGLASKARPAVSSSVRRACVLALHDVGTDAALWGLVPFLEDGEASVAGAADRAILSLIERRAADDAMGTSLPRVGKAVVAAIRSASDDRLRGVLTSIIVYGAPVRLSRASVAYDPDVAQWIQDPGPDAGSLKGVIRGSRHRVSRLRAWEWLSCPSVADACTDRLCRAADPTEHDEVLASMHLSVNPRRASAGRLVGVSSGLAVGAGGRSSRLKGEESAARSGAIPRMKDVAGLSSRAKWGLTRWIGVIGASVRVRRAVVRPLLNDSSPGVRLSAVRAASVADLEGPCGDVDVAVAGSAMVNWSMAGTGYGRGRGGGAAAESESRRASLERLLRSTHSSVRRMAMEDLCLIDPARASESWQASVTSAMAACPDPSGFMSWVSGELSSSQIDRVTRAVQIVRRAGLASMVQDLLAERFGRLPRASDDRAEPTLFTADTDRVAASIVSALSGIPPLERSAACRETLARARMDRDQRVRSNAVDGLARDARRGSAEPAVRGALVELKGDTNHRVRAGAVRGLVWMAERDHGVLDDPSGLVLGMITDERSAHRLAGAWLCERWLASGPSALVRGSAVVQRLREMARSEQDARLSERARRACHRAGALASRGAGAPC